MDGRKAKLSQFIFLELLFSSDAVDLVFISHEITDMLAFRLEAKSFAKYLLDKFNSVLSLLADS